MPRTKAKCRSCSKEITNLRKGTAKVIDVDFYSFEKKRLVPHRIYLHMECYEKDNQKVNETACN